MDIFKKSTLSAWLIGMLVTLNIITLIFLWIVHFRDNPVSQIKPVQREEKVMGMLKRELGLSAEQTRKFHNKRKMHFDHIQNLHSKIIQLKREMLQESFTTPVDSIKIRKLAREIGNLQAEKEIKTVYHFNQLHKECNQQQQCRFRSLIDDIFPSKNGNDRQDCTGKQQGRQSGLSRPVNRKSDK